MKQPLPHILLYTLISRELSSSLSRFPCAYPDLYLSLSLYHMRDTHVNKQYGRIECGRGILRFTLRTRPPQTPENAHVNPLSPPSLYPPFVCLSAHSSVRTCDTKSPPDRRASERGGKQRVTWTPFLNPPFRCQCCLVKVCYLQILLKLTFANKQNTTLKNTSRWQHHVKRSIATSELPGSRCANHTPPAAETAARGGAGGDLPMAPGHHWGPT